MLLASPIGLGMLLNIYQPIDLKKLRQSADGTWGLLEKGKIYYGLEAKPLKPPDNCRSLEFKMGDLVIDLVDGRYCYLLYFRVMATRFSYQVNVRLQPVDTLPIDDTPVTIDYSYQTDIGNIIPHDRVVKRVGSDVYAICCGTSPGDPAQIEIKGGTGVDIRTVDRHLYHPLDLAIGDRVSWHESGVVCEVISFRLDEDTHGFYRVMVAVTHLFYEQNQLLPDPDGVSWFPHSKIKKV